MMLLGFAGLGFAGLGFMAYRRTKKSAVVNCGARDERSSAMRLQAKMPGHEASRLGDASGACGRRPGNITAILDRKHLRCLLA